MRILYFTRNYSTHDHRFLSALAKTENEVFYLRLEGNSHALEDRSLPPEIQQVNWRGGRSQAKITDGPGLLRDLRRVIKKVNPDLILAGPIQRTAFLVALAGFQPLVSMSWGYDLLIDAKRNSFWRWATRYTLKRSAALVGDCDTIRQEAIRYGMNSKHIITFPWGIDLEHFSPAEENDDKLSSADDRPPFNILSTRGWEPIYGTDTIAKAFVKVSRKRSDIRLTMLGNGSQAGMLHQTFMRSGLLVDQASSQGAANINRVIFPGQISFQELPRYYRAADLYISASHSDGTSISLLEAMACGCPVLVSDIPGNKEWVTPDQNGWLFSEGDADAMAEKILHALDQRELLSKMGQSARQITEERANWEENFQKLFCAFNIALQDQ
jgi:glycosyltransferase involved in cell wall biosynthesis